MFKVEISTDNAAFADEPQVETARILRALADLLEYGRRTEGPLYDLNGNRVGDFTLNERPSA